MSVVIRQCTISEIENAPNIGEFLAEYARESAARYAPPHAAQMEMYKQMEYTGALYTVGAFVGELLIGVVNIIKSVLPHYGVLMAITESLFVLKPYRKTGAGIKLIAVARDYTREINAFGLLISAPFGGDLAEILSNRDDCQETNRVFFMRIKDV